MTISHCSRPLKWDHTHKVYIPTPSLSAAGSLSGYSQGRCIMCHTEHVHHRACSHWGRERIVGEYCCRARIINGRYMPCLYTENTGSVNSNDSCSQCTYQVTVGKGWKPFARVSNAGWARVEERMQQRGLRPIFPPGHIDGILTGSHRFRVLTRAAGRWWPASCQQGVQRPRDATEGV